MNALDRYFRITERGSSIGIEVRAGVATFLTMAYILFVNPQILADAGMPVHDVTLATAMAASVATLVMGLLANYPFALAPGMGLNAYFTYGVVIGMGVSYQTALAAVFVEGLLFLLLAFGGVRTAVVNAIPQNLKRAITAGIGLFLTIIGFSGAGFIEASPATFVTLGDLASPGSILAIIGLMLMAAMLSRGWSGAILGGIVIVTGAAWLTGLAPAPDSVAMMPALPSETLFALDFQGLLSGKLIIVIVAFLFVDFFDTAGSLIGIGRVGGFLDEQGHLPRANRAFTADAAGTTVGALLGTSTVTTYIESATGIRDGGRTGLTAVVVSLLFAASTVFTPLFVAVPAAATAPALIVVGALMMTSAREIDWDRTDEAVPAFLTIAAMPFTYSIANGIVFGIVSFAAIKLLSGRASDVHPIMAVLALIMVIYYGFTGGGV
jgi:adenine/guanine/hypoxanthine permease